MRPHDLPPDFGDPEIMNLRVPPHSIEAESSVLGGLLLDNRMWELCADVLTAGDFYRHENQQIFAAIEALINADKPADVVTVFAELQRQGKASDTCSLAYIGNLAQYVPSASNIRRYSEIVRERAILRQLIGVGDEVAGSAFDTQGKDAAELLDVAMGKLQALAIHRGGQEPVVVGDMALDLAKRVEALYRGEVQPGISTGIPSLNKRLNGGLRAGTQIILAARPSVGKSSLAMQICINLAEAGHPAAFLSQEMPKRDLMDRAGSNVGRILLDNIITGNLRGCEWPRLTEAVDKLQRLPLYLDDQPALTLSDIQSKARALVRQHGIKLLVLDYIQLCGSRKTAEKRHHQIEEISRGLKTLAKQLDITILALSQLNRGLESRIGGKPQLSDLKESGAIEEDADVVILLSQDHVADGGAKVIEANFAKNRQGRVGSSALAFDGGFQSWIDSGEPLNTPNAGRSRAAHTYTEPDEF